ncbi:hypothetical protein FIU88_05705 [Halomonas sp. THAF12]|uniref:AAA family ATPase n=1 Tax=Halomonas sp. THAF12 TaxID=2587849 RepID=UPI0012698091|nr:AAA family ATPase [Halomonas sp. THAF12]QFT84474.1 hypothetical protein FIU88_05705 [Halomonas sp. THAF12]
MSEDVFLEGVVFSNYKGVGDECQYLDGFGKVNFVIGENNSGKSSFLHFVSHQAAGLIEQYCGLVRERQLPPVESLDVHLGATKFQVVRGVGFSSLPVAEVAKESLLDKTGLYKGAYNGYCQIIDSVINSISYKGMIWLVYDQQANGLGEDKLKFLHEPDIDDLAEVSLPQVWQGLWGVVTKRGGGGFKQHHIPGVIAWIKGCIDARSVRVHFVPAIREITSEGYEESLWSGKGLIEKLAKLQNPSVAEREEKKKFDNINKFLSSVTNCEDAEIEVPHERDCVLVHMNGRVLPLSSLGTGIHEVVMIASFCTLVEDSIVCIEEPEIHLHPILQKRLINFIKEETSNQYFIATHSPSLIDDEESTVFRAYLDNMNSTKFLKIFSEGDKAKAVFDLGYRPSDLIQSNFIVWVEGPSDRVYLKEWIRLVDESLVEGVHYSVMFYGGRLLSHLTASGELEDGDDGEGLIRLLKINRRVCVLIDSDKKKSGDSLNPTKLRVIGELKESGGLSWVTGGKEIENYVPREVMGWALEKVYKKFSVRHRVGQYQNVLHFRGKDGEVYKNVDKVKVAKAAVDIGLDLDVLDLRCRAQELVSAIRQAN